MPEKGSGAKHQAGHCLYVAWLMQFSAKTCLTVSSSGWWTSAVPKFYLSWEHRWWYVYCLIQVNPFASLIDEVPLQCPRYLFNLDRVGESRSSGFLSRFDPLGGGGFDFSEDSRDVFCQGKVDDTIRVLAQKCGWEEELDNLYDELHAQSDPGSAVQENAKDSASTSKGDSDESNPDATEALAEQLKATKLDARTDAKSEKL